MVNTREVEKLVQKLALVRVNKGHEIESAQAEEIWNFTVGQLSKRNGRLQNEEALGYLDRIRELLSINYHEHFHEIIANLTLFMLEVDPARLDDFDAAMR